MGESYWAILTSHPHLNPLPPHAPTPLYFGFRCGHPSVLTLSLILETPQQLIRTERPPRPVGLDVLLDQINSIIFCWVCVMWRSDKNLLFLPFFSNNFSKFHIHKKKKKKPCESWMSHMGNSLPYMCGCRCACMGACPACVCSFIYSLNIKC